MIERRFISSLFVFPSFFFPAPSFIGYFDLLLFEGINFSFNGFSYLYPLTSPYLFHYNQGKKNPKTYDNMLQLIGEEFVRIAINRCDDPSTYPTQITISLIGYRNNRSK
jgi:hypothetical protein